MNILKKKPKILKILFFCFSHFKLSQRYYTFFSEGFLPPKNVFHRRTPESFKGGKISQKTNRREFRILFQIEKFENYFKNSSKTEKF